MKQHELLLEQRNTYILMPCSKKIKTEWVSQEKRRENHELVMFYKMCYDLTSSYLSSLVPKSVNNISQNSLRNTDSLQSIHARTNLYILSVLSTFCCKGMEQLVR